MKPCKFQTWVTNFFGLGAKIQKIHLGISITRYEIVKKLKKNCLGLVSNAARLIKNRPYFGHFWAVFLNYLGSQSKIKKNPHAWNQSTSILTIWKRKFNKISSHFCGPPILKDKFFHNQTWSANILEFSYGNTYFFADSDSALNSKWHSIP